MSGEPSEYTRTVRRPDPRRRESWCREGATHDHGACGNLWDSASRRDTTEAVRWVDEQGNPPAPWRFDVPEVPPSVTAFKSIDSDGDEQMWVRIGPDSWAVVWRGAVDWIETTGHPLRSLLKYPSLVECPDPRAAS